MRATVLGWVVGGAWGCGGEATPPEPKDCRDTAAGCPAGQPAVPDDIPPPPPGAETPPADPNATPPPDKEPEQLPPASGATLWLSKEGAAQDDLALDLAVDPSGDFFSAAVHGYDDLEARTPTDDSIQLVLTRRSGTGQTLWSRAYDVQVAMTPVELRADVRARIAADGAGGLLVAGNHQGLMDLGTGKLAGGTFVARLSGDGVTLWAHEVPAALTVADVAADAQGRLYVAYTAPDTVDLGAGVKGPSAGVAVFAPDGTPERAFAVGSAEATGAGAQPLALALAEDGSVAVAGKYVGAVRFGTQSTQAAGTGSPFVALYRTNGTLGWAKVRPGVKGAARDVSWGPSGDLVAGGDFQGTFSWAQTPLKGASGPSPFVVVTAADGTERWARDLGQDAQMQGVAMQASGEVLVTGYTYSWLENGTTGQDGLGAAQLFTQRFDPQGQALVSRLFLGVTPEPRGELYGVEAVPAVVLMPDGDAVLYGHTDRVTDFGVDKLRPLRGDVFLLRVKY
ncbi:hypothetical protein OV207_21365 [Corallococcus sp. BB11-1]|uniref:hypothetical protein n=1 Tax=Corallococcus sp. BB11-1 TaxID=2996783 RepID=UPI00226DE875|nr:hypothetical protein [Corallococcus sp. BB11-1]MCY1034017.1 hypothetical protein [Corallococcus sp. BB11-1]